MSNQIIEALKKLDLANDNHWTADGLPRLDTVKMLASDQTLTRELVEVAAPGFSRATALTWELPAQASRTTQQTAQPPAEQGSQAPQVQNTQSLPAEFTPVVIVDEAPAADLEDLEDRLAEQGFRVEEIRQERAKLEQLFHEERQKEDDLRAQVEAARPLNRNSDAISGYLHAQQLRLQERLERQKLLAESGINFKELTKGLQAPIDAARRRKG